MHQDIDPNATVNIPCPACGHKIEYTVAQLELRPPMRCPKCGTVFAVNYSKIMEKIKAAAEKAALERRRSGA
jgi:uncharacterized Zn finger protein